ncbi:MAG: chemotaxis protein CheA, partial [Bdellovibrionota bacterium]
EGASPAAPAPSAVARRETVSGTDSTVRVKTSLLDSFINAVGEMTVLRARLSRIAQERGDEELAEVSERLDVEVRNLYSRVMGVRLMPLDSVTSILPRMVRDVARRRGREVSFEVHGQDLEVDRSVLEVLLDPLIHILRNSVDHGIEPPEERVAAGKPREGNIRLLAYREREKTVIQISDDGRGLDPERLRMKAIDQGILTADAVSRMSDQEALQIICLPGFSTASEVTDTSGRGVGMNAVKNVLDRIGGILEIDSIPGKGTTFQLFLPRSVAIVPVLLVSAAGEVFGFPLSRVTRTLSVDPTELHVSRGRRFCLVEGETIPVVNLAEVFGVSRREKRAGGNGEELLVLVEREGGEIAVQVDAFAGHEEAFVKPLGKPMDRIPCLGGVFISGSGRPIFVVETGGLLPAGAARSRGNPAYPAGMRS